MFLLLLMLNWSLIAIWLAEVQSGHKIWIVRLRSCMNVFYKFNLDREPTWLLVIKHSAGETFFQCLLLLNNCLWFIIDLLLLEIDNAKTPEWCYWLSSSVFSVSFEQILHIVLVFTMWTSKRQLGFPSVGLSVANERFRLEVPFQ